MNRVMLIEDEPPILHMVKQMIESSPQGFVVSQTAYNGQKALALLAEGEHKPDLIITDIRMPVMDGLKFMKELAFQGYDIPCIILSGYSDFNYAREALQSKACDYLLKPVRMDHLERTLAKAASLLSDRRRDGERAFLKKALRLPDDSGTRAIRPMFSYYQVLLIRRGCHWNESWDERFPISEDWLSRIEEDTKTTHALESSWWMSGMTTNEKIVLRGINDQTREALCREQVDAMIARIRSIDEMAGMPISMAISEPVTCERLAATLREIREGLACGTVIGESQVWWQGDHRRTEFVLTAELEQACYTLAKSADYRSFEKTMGSWREQWSKQGLGQFAIERLMSTITRHFLAHWRLDAATEITAFDANELLSGCRTLEEAISQFNEYIRVLYDLLKHTRPDRSAKDLIENVKRYLDEHYMQPIGSESLQHRFGYHKTYIANVFSDVVGLPPGKYLTKLRIEKAIALLRDRRDLSLRQIAEQVGYTDNLYFSKVFKSATGLSPKEYKERQERHEYNDLS